MYFPHKQELFRVLDKFKFKRKLKLKKKKKNPLRITD